MKTVYIAALFTAFGGILSGFDTGVISGALLYIKNDWNLSELMQGILVSSVLAGAAIGTAMNGHLADILGRAKIIKLTALIFLIASVLCAISPDIYFLIFSRFLIGFAIGMITFAAPLYISEISPKEIRGALVSMFQLAITAGILVSYISNALFAHYFASWRLMFISGIIPAFILLIGFLFMPDTPRWYILKGEIEKAKKLFLKFGIDDFEFCNTDNINNKIKFEKYLIFPLLIGIFCMFIQQWTGINTIIYFSPIILQNAGFVNNQNAITAAIGIGVLNFLMTFAAIFLTDKIGRKPLLYIGLSGMAICLLILSFAFSFDVLLGENMKYFALFVCTFYIAFFAISLGPIMILLVSEIFPLKVRSLMMSICMMSNFIFNFLLSLLFLPMIKKIGESCMFTIFAIIAIFSILFVKFMLPETKGQTLEAIEKRWKNV